MKKIVFASVMALASFSLIATPALRAQDQITIKDPAEFNAYQMAITQSDEQAKASALEELFDHVSAKRGEECGSRRVDRHLSAARRSG